MARPRKLNEFRIEGDTVWIKLTQGKETCVDLADWPVVRERRWNAQKHRRGWRAICTQKRGEGSRLLHRLLCGVAGLQVDHKNGDGLDNRRENLRPATNAQNARNRGKFSNGVSSAFKGVGFLWRAKKFRARIAAARPDGQRYLKSLGCFASEESAARAYDTEAVLLHGEFARLNFPVPQDTAA